MTSLFDAGDLQRLDVERRLTEQAPRVLPEEPSDPPVEEPVSSDPLEEMRDRMFSGMLDILKERFS